VLSLTSAEKGAKGAVEELKLFLTRKTIGVQSSTIAAVSSVNF
jgi:hypothetical protein